MKKNITNRNILSAESLPKDAAEQPLLTCEQEVELARRIKEEDEEAFKELYFLPKGEGYWVFESWSKGVIYYFKGNHYKYSIIDRMLYDGE